MTVNKTPPGARRRIGMLGPKFPGQTHIFFWRETMALRAMGAEIEWFSTQRPPADIVCHAWAPEAMKQTVYLFPLTFQSALGALAEMGRSGPMRLGRCLGVMFKARGLAPLQRTRLMGLMLTGASLAREARRRRIDHLHVHSCADAAFLALFARLLSGLPYSMTLHGPVQHYGGGQEIKWKHASFGITVTHILRDELLAREPGIDKGKIDIAPMGVDVSKFQRSRPYAPAPGAGPWRIITCGRLHLGKGHQDLIRAVGLMRSEGDPVELEILGEGDARAELTALITELKLEGAVRLLGAVDEDEVRRRLEAAHIFALASHNEALGVATMEAMAMRMPVVATRVGGVPLLVRDGVDGLLVEAKQLEQLTAALRRIACDPEMARRMGEQGDQRVRQSFSSEVSARAILSRLGVTMESPRRTESPEPVLSGDSA